MRDLLVSYVQRFIGLPYRWGGDDPINGYDCSGLVQEALAAIGIDPPGDQTAQGLHDHFRVAGLPSAIPSTGALLFFGRSESAVTHVAISIDGRHMVEAGGGGSTTTSAEAAAKSNAYVRIRPVASRKDLVAIIIPPFPTR